MGITNAYENIRQAHHFTDRWDKVAATGMSLSGASVADGITFSIHQPSLAEGIVVSVAYVVLGYIGSLAAIGSVNRQP